MTEIITENMTSDLVLSELSESSVEEPSQKANKKRGAKITNPARWLPDGTYDNSLLDPEYYKKYYHRKYCTPYTCECGVKLCNEQKLKRHLLTARCQKKRMIKQSQQQV